MTRRLCPLLEKNVNCRLDLLQWLEMRRRPGLLLEQDIGRWLGPLPEQGTKRGHGIIPKLETWCGSLPSRTRR